MREIESGLSMIQRTVLWRRKGRRERRRGRDNGVVWLVTEGGLEWSQREDKKRASHFPALANGLSVVRLLPPFFSSFKKAGAGLIPFSSSHTLPTLFPHSPTFTRPSLYITHSTTNTLSHGTQQRSRVTALSSPYEPLYFPFIAL